MESWSDDNEHPTSKEKNFKLNRSEIIEQQNLIINQWKPSADMWPLKYGNIALYTTSAITAVYINSQFRRYLYIRYVPMGSTVAMAIAPACISYLSHYAIRNKIIAREYGCPACIEVGSSLTQVALSIGYPIILSGALNLMIAAHEGLGVPGYSDWRGLSKFFKTVLKPLRPALTAAVLFHAVLGAFVAHKELTSMSLIEGALLKYYQEKFVPRSDKTVELN